MEEGREMASERQRGTFENMKTGYYVEDETQAV